VSTLHGAWPRARLFWKVFLACWLTAGLTGLCLTLVSRFWPNALLPPMPDAPKPSWVAPLVIGACLALILSGLMAWHLLRAIRRLQHALSEVARGNLTVRLSSPAGRQGDELTELGRDFDSMVQHLQDLMGAQRRLLHDVSHELRSPLARMHALIGLGSQCSSAQVDAFVRLEHEVGRLDSLVGEVLTLARMESAVAPLTWEPLNVLALLRAVSEDAGFEAEFANKALSLRVEGEGAATGYGEGWSLIGHGESLYRAFDNVLRNAVKYTAEGSTVEVTAGMASQHLFVHVADRGPGVAEAACNRMFEPFVRIHGQADSSGFGLGLAIARSAIERHRGAISAHPRDGGGLIVRIQLPLTDGAAEGAMCPTVACITSGLSRAFNVKK
jgi:two-component system OmpR family sensor kinase